MRHMLFRLEELLTLVWIADWPTRVSPRFEGLWAMVWLTVINAIRRLRFGVSCKPCESCGHVYPMDDLHLTLKSDGCFYPECTSCENLGNLLRAAHVNRPRAA